MRGYPVDDIPAERNEVPVSAFGRAITAAEVEKRLSSNLYDQLSEKDTATVQDAIARAQIYVGSILRGFGLRLDLDNSIIREVVLLNTIYELHMALGHAEAGKEYKDRAKDIILVTWGDYRDAENAATSGASPAGGIAVPSRRPGRYRKALRLGAAR